ncbi:SDR family NAD(P)-dependent oxidoreductase [Ferrovibrio sp.]|uniref:SDR family NAD(P)-dependent oxidoreductase n=1 Tax=Ferrovibrio sp. TaxID=1917215 RepID=UPI0026085DD1|nr:SDR family NAD(P)-dependent oxidoreductase [Ferrovibrio sp.]
MSVIRHAVITGGGIGIGLSIARGLAHDGFALSLLRRDRSRLERAASDIGNAKVVACNVTDTESVSAAFNQATANHGPIGVLVNNAGIVRTAPFLKQTDADWNGMWQTNVLGAVNTIRQVIDSMRSHGDGGIINIASTAALKAYDYSSAYVATKHALLGLTRSLDIELAATRVTVNAVCPGCTDTDIIRTAVNTIIRKTGKTLKEARAAFTAANPQDRLIEPEEIAGAVRWLVRPDSRSITGQAIAIAGGEVM